MDNSIGTTNYEYLWSSYAGDSTKVLTTIEELEEFLVEKHPGIIINTAKMKRDLEWLGSFTYGAGVYIITKRIIK